MHVYLKASTDPPFDHLEIYPDVEDRSPSTEIDSLLRKPTRRREVEKSLLRKLDLRVAFLVLVYMTNYMVRANVASARLKGLENDLHMKGQQFNALISCFYIGYIFMQIPSNILLHQLTRPSAYISCSVFVWGVISIGTGASQSFREVLVYRFLLGLSEATFLSGALFILSTWYRCDELGLRIAYLFCGASLSSSLGYLIESSILATMDGRLGYAAWRWLFFTEGGFTCVVALLAFCLVPDFPTKRASWLTAEEQFLAQERMLQGRRGIIDDSLKTNSSCSLVDALTDLTVWWLAVPLVFVNMSQSFLAFFPTIAATIGYSPSVTLLLCVPPQILYITASFLISSHSDRTGKRFWYTAGSILTTIIGFLLAALTMDNGLRYMSLFFMCISPVSYVLLTQWTNDVVPEPSKRAVAIAFLNVSATVADIISAYMWPSSWGPSYSKSFLLCVLMSLAALGMLWGLRTHLKRLNAIAELNEVALGLPMGFRYTI